MKLSKKVFGFALALVMALTSLTLTSFVDVNTVSASAEEAADLSDNGEVDETTVDTATEEEAPVAEDAPAAPASAAPATVDLVRETTSGSAQAQKIVPTGIPTPVGAVDFALGAEVSASSALNWDWNGPDQAVNGNLSNDGYSRWASAPLREEWYEIDGKNYAWFFIDIGTIQTIDRLTVIERANTEIWPNGRVESWIVETSINYHDWTEVASGRHLAGSTTGNMMRDPLDIDFVPIQARYVEIFMEYNPTALAIGESINISQFSLYNTDATPPEAAAAEPAAAATAATDPARVSSEDYVPSSWLELHSIASPRLVVNNVNPPSRPVEAPEPDEDDNHGYEPTPIAGDYAFGRPIWSSVVSGAATFGNPSRLNNGFFNLQNVWTAEVKEENFVTPEAIEIPDGNWVSVTVDLEATRTFDRMIVTEVADRTGASAWPNGRVDYWVLMMSDDDIIYEEIARGYNLAEDVAGPGSNQSIRAPFIVDIEVFHGYDSSPPYDPMFGAAEGRYVKLYMMINPEASRLQLMSLSIATNAAGIDLAEGNEVVARAMELGEDNKGSTTNVRTLLLTNGDINTRYTSLPYSYFINPSNGNPQFTTPDISLTLGYTFYIDFRVPGTTTGQMTSVNTISIMEYADPVKWPTGKIDKVALTWFHNTQGAPGHGNHWVNTVLDVTALAENVPGPDPHDPFVRAPVTFTFPTATSTSIGIRFWLKPEAIAEDEAVEFVSLQMFYDPELEDTLGVAVCPQGPVQ